MIHSLFFIYYSYSFYTAKDRYGWTPLHCASHHGNIQCVNQLLNAGASVSIVDKNGRTPLHVVLILCQRCIRALYK